MANPEQSQGGSYQQPHEPGCSYELPPDYADRIRSLFGDEQADAILDEIHWKHHAPDVEDDSEQADARLDEIHWKHHAPDVEVDPDQAMAFRVQQLVGVVRVYRDESSGKLLINFRDGQDNV